ncbi:hypothetical protein [Bacillus pseudomycoides]|nr:hypothetical protein [Bacillus pseudomycoides]
MKEGDEGVGEVMNVEIEEDKITDGKLIIEWVELSLVYLGDG